MDAGIDGQPDIAARHGVPVADLALDDALGVALQDACSGRAAEVIIQGQFELRFALGVGLVVVEAGGVLLVDLRRVADIAEEVRTEGTVIVAPHGPHGEVDAGHPDVVFRQAARGVEVEILEVEVRDLGVVAEVEAQLAGVVIAGQAEFGQARHGGFVDDLDDVRFHFLGEHAAHGGAVGVAGHIAVAVAVVAHHVGQVEFHRVAGAVAGQGKSVAVGDLSAHGGEADIDLRVAAESGGVFFPARDLHLPEPAGEQDEAGGEDGGDDGDAEFVRAADHGVSRRPRRALVRKPPGQRRKKK